MPVKVLLKDKTELDALPEVLQHEYDKQDDGTYVLKVEDKDYTTKVREFRDNNIKLKKQQDETARQLEKYKDVDPEKYLEALEKAKKLDELETKNLVKAGDLDELIAKRTETMRKDYDGQIAGLKKGLEENTGKANDYRERLRNMKVEGTVRDIFSKVATPRPGAMKDILNRAKEVWKLDDNDELVAEDLFNDKGQPMGMEEWAKRTTIETPYLFEPSSGGGAPGGKPGSGLNKPGSKTLHSPTPREFGANLEDIASGKVEVTGITA